MVKKNNPVTHQKITPTITHKTGWGKRYCGNCNRTVYSARNDCPDCGEIMKDEQ